MDLDVSRVQIGKMFEQLRAMLTLGAEQKFVFVRSCLELGKSKL
jgi:hypothetical protein